jgi:hypothetical protein
MTVLCIKNSISHDPNAILVTEGCTYNVTNICKREYLVGTDNNTWYELLETGNCLHHSTLFVEAEQEPEKELIENLILKHDTISSKGDTP